MNDKLGEKIDHFPNDDIYHMTKRFSNDSFSHSRLQSPCDEGCATTNRPIRFQIYASAPSRNKIIGIRQHAEHNESEYKPPTRIPISH